MLVAVIMLLAIHPPMALSQAIDLDGEGEGLPIQIKADQGLEWAEEQSVVTARGNATAIRGDVRVQADTLSAHYREDASGKAEVWRLEALGNVKITAPERWASADRGIYDIERSILVLNGDGGVRLVGEEGEITADEQVEYWEREKMVVARGNAQARQGDRGLEGDVLIAYLSENASGKSTLQRVEAFEDVNVYTPHEQARANRGVYTVDSGLASLVGDVRITRGGNQLRGCRAEVDMRSGVSKLFGCRGGQGVGQVKGLLRPEAETERKP